MRTVTDVERRHRLARRHALAPGHRAADPEAATRAMTVLHATEAPSVYLSLWARVDGLARRRRRPGALRRPHAGQAARDAPHAVRLPARPAARRVGERLGAGGHARCAPGFAKEVEAAGLAADGAAWLASAEAAALDRLADGGELSAPQLREQVPELDGRLDIGEGAYAANVPSRRACSPSSASRRGSCAAATAATGGPPGRSGPRWRPGSGEVPEPGRRARATPSWSGAGCATFGPGTEADLVWWLGSTKTAVRAALADLAAVEVALEDGGTGVPPGRRPRAGRAAVEPWAALLPVLDPTVMGWKERGVLPRSARPDALRHQRQRRHHRVVGRPGRRLLGAGPRRRRRVRACSRTSAPTARAALAAEAERLTGWLDGPPGQHGLPVDCDEAGASRP